MIHKILGERYEIQQQLAKKAGRRTLLARDLVSSELVVAKLLNFSDDFEWEDLKLFEREAQTLKALSHPAIPQYLDYLELETENTKGFALIQTYVARKSLEEYLYAGRTFTEVEVKEIAQKLLKILIYLHERQPPVIHRDIKPSNILLGDRSGNSVGQIYLVDFGSVQTLAAKKGGTITVVGTYGYMPPEQFGDRAVPASDLYSLGATLIALVTGSHPADLPQKDGRIQFENLANVSTAFAEWLKWMTEPSLDKRLSSAEKALDALNNPQLNSSLVIQQPKGSKIRLVKTRDCLEIIIGGSVRLGYLMGSMVGGTIAFIFGMFGMQVVSLVSFPWNIILAIMSGLSVTGGFFSLLSMFFVFNKKQIKVDKQHFMVNSYFLGKKITHIQSQREDITKFVYIPRYLRNNGEGAVDEPPKLTIWMGAKSYQIGGNFSFILDSELEWIAEELSHWLNIPITRVKKELSRQ